MSNNSKVFISIIGLGCIFGCSSKSVVPGAERLRIFEAEPKGCLYMGEVASVQDNDDTVVAKGKKPEMTLDTRIDLRNKAFKLNGNILVFLGEKKAKLATTNQTVVDISKQSSKTGDKDSSMEAQNEKIPQTVFLGTVFRCPPNILNQ